MLFGCCWRIHCSCLIQIYKIISFPPQKINHFLKKKSVNSKPGSISWSLYLAMAFYFGCFFFPDIFEVSWNKHFYNTSVPVSESIGHSNKHFFFENQCNNHTFILSLRQSDNILFQNYISLTIRWLWVSGWVSASACTGTGYLLYWSCGYCSK